MRIAGSSCGSCRRYNIIARSLRWHRRRFAVGRIRSIVTGLATEWYIGIFALQSKRKQISQHDLHAMIIFNSICQRFDIQKEDVRLLFNKSLDATVCALCIESQLFFQQKRIYSRAKKKDTRNEGFRLRSTFRASPPRPPFVTV